MKNANLTTLKTKEQILEIITTYLEQSKSDFVLYKGGMEEYLDTLLDSGSFENEAICLGEIGVLKRILIEITDNTSICPHCSNINTNDEMISLDGGDVYRELNQNIIDNHGYEFICDNCHDEFISMYKYVNNAEIRVLKLVIEKSNGSNEDLVEISKKYDIPESVIQTISESNAPKEDPTEVINGGLITYIKDNYDVETKLKEISYNVLEKEFEDERFTSEQVIIQVIDVIGEDDEYSMVISAFEIKKYLETLFKDLEERFTYLSNVNILECEICKECGTVLSPDDDCYSSHNGKELCSSCSAKCEGCDKYYTDNEGVYDEHDFCCQGCKEKEKKASSKIDVIKEKMTNLVMYRGTKEEIITKINSIGLRDDSILEAFEEPVCGNDLGFNSNLGKIDDKYLDFEIYLLPTMEVDTFIVTEVNEF